MYLNSLLFFILRQKKRESVGLTLFYLYTSIFSFFAFYIIGERKTDLEYYNMVSFNVRILFVDVGVKKLNILFVEGRLDDVAREPS